jgi:ABC-2 family transporter protein
MNLRLSRGRIRAVMAKELRDYRRNRFIAYSMVAMPILFMVAPMITIFNLPADAASGKLDAGIGVTLLYLTLIPALVPAVVSSYAIVGEHEQGTLEPVLTTPLRREELLIGKALAAYVPTLLISYAMYGIFLLATGIFAHRNVADDIFQPGRIVAQLRVRGDDRTRHAHPAADLRRQAPQPGAHLHRRGRVDDRVFLPHPALPAAAAHGAGASRPLDRVEAALAAERNGPRRGGDIRPTSDHLPRNAVTQP